MSDGAFSIYQEILEIPVGGVVNGTCFFGSFHWKISRKIGTSEKVVAFSHSKLFDGTACSIYEFHKV